MASNAILSRKLRTGTFRFLKFLDVWLVSKILVHENYKFEILLTGNFSDLQYKGLVVSEVDVLHL